MPLSLDPERLEEFARRIAAHPRRRVDRAAIWSAFAAAFPARPQGAEERAWLAEAINRLAARGMVRLPAQSGPRWDRTMGLALPLSLDLQREVSPPNREWRTFPWHPRLQWIGDMKSLPVEQEKFLSRVHEGLVAGWFGRPAPMKYRSLQLTGDEKMLARLGKTKLFGPSRLDLPLLGCFEDLPPLAWERISDKTSLIVFENTGSFAVARQALASLPDPPYGMVACGEGARIQRSLAQLASLRGVLERIEYVGDLDHEGLRIALAAGRSALAAGLPEIEPAAGLHRAMLASARRFGHATGWPCGSPIAKVNERTLEFLPAEIRADVRKVLAAGRRIPEEVLGPDELLAAWLKAP